MNQQQEFRRLFLEELIRRIITSPRYQVYYKPQKPIIQVQPKEFAKAQIPLAEKAPSQKPIAPAPQPYIPIRVVEIAPLPPLQQIPPGNIRIESFSRINHLLSDPLIQAIECLGPGKPLVVTRAGFVQTTSTTLTLAEIKSILNELSEKTRIPLLSGIFKVAVQNLVITSVISEFADPRFIIQKRTYTPPTLPAYRITPPGFVKF